MAFAVVLQNCMHPKNAQRAEAVKAGTYVEVNLNKDAERYLSDVLRVNLQYELQGAVAQVSEYFTKLNQMNDIKVLMEAPDVYIAAAALSTKEFYQGKGDRTAFFQLILDTNPATIPDLGRKLALVSGKEYLGLKLYNDKLCDPSRVKKATVY